MAGQAPSPPSKGMAASYVTSVQLPLLHCVHSASLILDAPNQNSNQKLLLQAVSSDNGGGLVEKMANDFSYAIPVCPCSHVTISEGKRPDGSQYGFRCL